MIACFKLKRDAAIIRANRGRVMDIIDVKRSENAATEAVDNQAGQPQQDTSAPEGQPDPKVPGAKVSKINSKAIPWILLCLVLLAGVGATLYYRNRASEAENNPTAIQQEKNQAETDRVLSALKKVLFVGEQEAPTVARVEDPEKLKSSNQEFYKDIQKGDYLIIFPKRAIIFRESANQIMNIAPIINTADLKATEGTQPAETAPNNSTKKTTN
jgi:hypothetical protein